jgi:deazaflavin-dependent oxidoreductase (nitroreductase family)
VANWNSGIIEQFRAKGGVGIPNFGDRLLLLTTRGAKSGRPHTTPLAYTRDGDRYVVIASKGGAPTHPDWYHNIVQHGQAEVEVGTEHFPVRVVALASGPEHDRLYDAQAQVMPGFREYQERATRIIPVVVLERDEATALAA